MKEELKKLGLHFIVVDLGEIEIMEDISEDKRDNLKTALLDSGLELMDDKKAVLIEKGKKCNHRNGALCRRIAKINYSDYISEKLKYDYTYLSNLFRR